MEEPTVTKSKEGTAGPEFNKEHAHCFFHVKVFDHGEFVLSDLVNSDFSCDVLRLERNYSMKKTGNLVQPQLAPSSQQCTCQDVPETMEFVTNNKMFIVPRPPSSLELTLCYFALFPKFKMELKGHCFETVPHSKGITISTQQH
jgi:hypothetical protein